MNKIFVLLFLVLCYLYANTGLHGDDYIFLSILEGKSFSELLKLIASYPGYLKNPVVMLFNFTQFHFFEYNIIFYDFIKTVISLGAIYIVYLFLNDYISRYKAIVISIFFILFPTHDATSFWIVGKYMVVTLSFIILSHYLINNNRKTLGFIVGIFGSFASYASLPFVFGLSVIFLFKRQYDKFIIFVVPQILYIIYYFSISKIFDVQAIKGSSDFTALTLFKQYVLQVGTFADSVIGPSFWLKIYYSLMELTIISLLIGSLLTIIFYKFYKPRNENLNKQLLLAFIIVTLSAFGIYSLTGLYPQIAFNLGNRVTIYGSLLISFLIVMFLMNNKKSATIVFAFFIFSTLGISDHWKAWNVKQQDIINNIKTHSELKTFDRQQQLFVSHNQYSKFGDMVHIEFFSQGIETFLFKLATNKDYNVSTLNRRFVYDDGYILDKKFGRKFIVGDFIYVYNSESNILIKIEKNKIQQYIDNLPMDRRHWVQLLDKNSYIMKIVMNLMPRLKYAL